MGVTLVTSPQEPGTSVGDLTGATAEPCRATPEPVFGPIHGREKQKEIYRWAPCHHLFPTGQISS